MGRASFIAIDWGTSSFRAYRVEAGCISAETSGPHGILTIAPGGHAEALTGLLAPLGDRASDWPLVMSGMIGSRQGWREAPYVPTPASITDVARAAMAWDEPNLGHMLLLPGVSHEGATMPDVMRGEETQICGALALLKRDAGVFIMPGTHSKCVAVRNGRIEAFRSFMTGEVFAALKEHTILGRLMQAGQTTGDGFAQGVRASMQLSAGGDLMHAVFGARTLGLFDRLPPTELEDYLSGLLIGAELCAALPAGGSAFVVGSNPLNARYAEAARMLGRTLEAAPPDSVVVGQMSVLECL